MSKILNYNPEMEYRRFGKTNQYISTITLGTMRFEKGWEQPSDQIPPETLKHTVDVLKWAFESGINHIETANGYVKSEKALGLALNDELKIPRANYHLMTKSNGKTAKEIREIVEKQLDLLKTDFFDFYAWHGINNKEILADAIKKGGAVEELLKMKDEGIIKHIGFSTHAPLGTINEAIETGLFEFVNLHYYYFMQRNLPAVKLAGKNDLGVFIISPNDKGGMLFAAPEKVKNAVIPSTPIQWNARFCLSNPEVNTLSFGMTQESHFKEMESIFPSSIPFSDADLLIKNRLDDMVHDDRYSYYDAYELVEAADAVNIPSVLRLRKLWKCYDMIDYARYRYNVYEQKSHWFPGLVASDKNIAASDLSKVPSEIPIVELLKETHKALREDKFENLKIVKEK